jgi:hypothetical protein
MSDATGRPVPEPCSTLWIGGALGAVERACLRSVLRQGHPLTLYCYDRPLGVPEGVKVADAAQILPRARIIRHTSGSPAIFADWFRYELQRLAKGIWIDCDVYLLAPLPPRACLFGWEAPGRINNAVLRLPANSPILPPLLALFEERAVPPWLPARARLAANWRLATSGRTGVAHMPWGSTGPVALTALAREHGLESEALAQEVFYPTPWQEAGWIGDPQDSVERRTGPATIALHLWNERIKDLKGAPAPRGSFLAQLHHEGAPEGEGKGNAQGKASAGMLAA